MPRPEIPIIDTLVAHLQCAPATAAVMPELPRPPRLRMLAHHTVPPLRSHRAAAPRPQWQRTVANLAPRAGLMAEGRNVGVANLTAAANTTKT